MQIPAHLTRVLQHEGVAAIATHGPEGPHLVNTWNSYIHIDADGQLLVPAGGMHRTEANLAGGSLALLTVGTREEQGFHGAGTGCLIRGQAQMLQGGPEFDQIKARFPWARAVLVLRPEAISQTL